MPLQFDPTVGASNLGLKGGLTNPKSPAARFAAAQSASGRGSMETFANLVGPNEGTSICRVAEAGDRFVLVPTRNGGFISVQLPEGAPMPKGAIRAAQGMFTRCAPQDIVAERRARAAHLAKYRKPFQKGHKMTEAEKAKARATRARKKGVGAAGEGWTFWDGYIAVGATVGIVAGGKMIWDFFKPKK